MTKVKDHYIVVEIRTNGAFTSGLQYGGLKTAFRKAKWMARAGFRTKVMKVSYTETQ